MKCSFNKSGMLYFAENASRLVVKSLREKGYDFEDGAADQGTPADVVLKKATELDRIVVTRRRRDFKKLHKQNPNHAGIIICTEDTNHEALANRIDAAIRKNPDMKGRLVSVTRPS
ncbi:MAG: DUF5615 family PIN-like protein [bacterium]|nr:DUF5615 family PIN-like protein [bacterium]